MVYLEILKETTFFLYFTIVYIPFWIFKNEFKNFGKNFRKPDPRDYPIPMPRDIAGF